MTDHTQAPYTFMAVHAHPDDEVFGTGGTYAKLAASGVRTVLVTATGGEEGEIVDPALSEAEKQAMTSGHSLQQIDSEAARIQERQASWPFSLEHNSVSTP